MTMGYHQRFKTTEQRFYEKVEKTDGCWLWTGANNPGGYGTFYINGKREKAHRVSYILHKGKIADGMCILHSCDNPVCVNPDHLREGTKSDNTKDAVSRGRQKNLGKKGVINRYASKLTELQVQRIRIVDGAISDKDYAKILGIDTSTVNLVRRRKRWSSLGQKQALGV